MLQAAPRKTTLIVISRVGVQAYSRVENSRHFGLEYKDCISSPLTIPLNSSVKELLTNSAGAPVVLFFSNRTFSPVVLL